MIISRNQPGVATCDECREPKRPVVSWSLADNSDGLGVQGLGSVHLCRTCLETCAAKLAALPPFAEVMRHELFEAGVAVAPKARYDEVRALYQEHGLESRAQAVAEARVVLPSNDQTFSPAASDLPPTLPAIRRMPRAELEAATHRYMPWVTFETMTREQMIEGLVAHFESAPAETRA